MRSGRRKQRDLLVPLRRLALPAGLFATFVVSGQALDTEQLAVLDDDATDITYEDLTVDELEDMDLVRDGEVIGEVEEVLADDSGEIVALVIEHGGNLLGLGDQEVVVPIDELEFPAGREEVETTMTDEELAELERWDGDD